jgi:hypothetical protein
MLACVGCWNCRDLGPVGSGDSAESNTFWSEGFELSSSRGCAVSCCWVEVCPLVLVNLGTDRLELGAAEDSELGSSPFAGERAKQVYLCWRRCASFTVYGLCCAG